MVKPLARNQMAWRAAQDLEEGTYVNLGIGMPLLASNYAPPDREIVFQSENGIVGIGPLAEPERADADLVDAGGQMVTLRPGAGLVGSVEAFGMIRGGHIDVTLLGGFEVAENGDLANWELPGSTKGPLVGGAMDLAVGARSVRIIMAHCTKQGEPRLVKACTYPLTGLACVDRIYTDLAVVDVTPKGFLIVEFLEGITREELQARSGAPLRFSENCQPLEAPDL